MNYIEESIIIENIIEYPQFSMELLLQLNVECITDKEHEIVNNTINVLDQYNNNEIEYWILSGTIKQNMITLMREINPRYIPDFLRN